LKKQTDNIAESYMELEESEGALILKVRKKKTPAEKKAILDELAGSGLEHGPEVIKDALEISFRERARKIGRI
jgi:hypothetical protein